MREFLSEYAAGSEDLLGFYGPSLESLRETPPAARNWDSQLVAAMKSFQSERGGNSRFTGSEAVIITGQQPGIFTGPLYTIYKAITAIVLAKRLEDRFGVATVPVFWVGSEDHDFDEACTAYFLTKTHEPLPIRYTPSTPVDDLPMYQVPVEDCLHASIDEAAANTSGSEFREEVAAMLHETLDASDSLADWTARSLMRLFAETPLVFFAPHLPEARRLASPILEREIHDPLTSTATLNKAGRELERLGFAPQVVKGANECSFFLETGGERRKVVFEKDRFVTPGDECTFSAEELLEILDRTPERFSPNVALRCVVQQHLFPAAAYIAGPGELAYWAQLKGIFERHEQPMPVVYPRASCALTSIKLNKLLRKLNLTVGDLVQHEDNLLHTAARSTSTNPAYTFEREQRGALEAALSRLAEGLEKDAPTAAAMARSLVDDVGTKLDRIERAILASDGVKNEATRKQLQRLCNSLAPNRKPQERVYTIFSYLFEHGWDLIPRLLEELDIDSFQMTEVEL